MRPSTPGVPLNLAMIARRSSRRVVRSGCLACVMLIAGLVLGLAPELLAQSVGPGGPILVVTTSVDPFSSYYAEILRAEGLNAFATVDIATISDATLAAYDVVILPAMPLTSAQVSIFSNWLNGGGNLIAMRPDKQLAGLLGLSDASATLTDTYLLVDTAAGPGVGIVNETIQFHGPADLYALTGARAIATLYADATTATPYPAVTWAGVGASGGQAAVFTYDLARSIIYTRQGNPAWSGQDRDALPPTRSDDLFFGAASFDPQPDWIDLNKVAIPQADEQQRLLVNLLLAMTASRKPLPRFWYFPNGQKAVIIMTGDDHARGGTAGRFDTYLAVSPPGCSVANWECIRSTSYIYTSGPLSDAQAAAYTAAGFEIALHIFTDCTDWTPAFLDSTYTIQLSDFQATYPSLPAPATVRTHCGPWSDYVTQPQVEVNHGIRLDTNYYYWPGSWIADRPGMFTGSGMPMRFASSTGSLIDVYQATTQMTDESGQSYPFTVNSLLDNALGPAGFYGAFTVNAHTDNSTSDVSDSVVAAALARGVPIVSARQMLTWLDGRNNSSFGGLAWDGQTLTFTVSVGNGADGLLQAMVPTSSQTGTLLRITRDATPIAFITQTIKGVTYAFFPAGAGTHQATFTAGNSVTITFDDPVPPGNSGDLLNGVFRGIDFGTGQWRWEAAFSGASTNHIFFDSADGTSRLLTFSPAPRVLNSIRVFGLSDGTLTLSDDRGQTRTQTLSAGSMQVVTTGWIQASSEITVSYTSGWDLSVDDINYR